jgi:uncharacterized membrane protein
MSEIIETVEVDVPVRTAYDQWTQFESFPMFMEGVERVEQLDDTTLRWTAEIAGQKRSWKARITEQAPDQRIAWTSIEGAKNAGVVTFHRLDDQTSKVTVQMTIDPEGFVENVGDKAGILDHRVKGDLERFKEFIESRGTETGAWRGDVDRPDDRN